MKEGSVKAILLFVLVVLVPKTRIWRLNKFLLKNYKYDSGYEKKYVV
jgi:hypothetical protein